MEIEDRAPVVGPERCDPAGEEHELHPVRRSAHHAAVLGGQPFQRAPGAVEQRPVGRAGQGLGHILGKGDPGRRRGFGHHLPGALPRREFNRHEFRGEARNAAEAPTGTGVEARRDRQHPGRELGRGGFEPPHRRHRGQDRIRALRRCHGDEHRPARAARPASSGSASRGSRA